VDIHGKTGNYIIPLHEFSKAAILGDYSHFVPESSLAMNVFDVESPDRREHFLSFMIVVRELTYTADDMAPFARDIGYVDVEGHVMPPFAWNEERRLSLRTKLDAVYFHLYGVTNRDDVRYIYSTFPIVEREEMAADGSYSSRELCLAYMSALAAGDPDAEIRLGGEG
jgi:hypothetical protein